MPMAATVRRQILLTNKSTVSWIMSRPSSCVFVMRHILLTKGLLQAHSVVHRLKDPYLVQKIGGAVAVIEGGDDCAFADDNPVQIWHPEVQPNLPAGKSYNFFSKLIIL